MFYGLSFSPFYLEYTSLHGGSVRVKAGRTTAVTTGPDDTGEENLTHRVPMVLGSSGTHPGGRGVLGEQSRWGVDPDP